jgi:hypothetical protein
MDSSVPKTDPRIQHVEISEDTLTVDLADGRRLAVPLTWFPGLLHATEEQRKDWELLGDGEGSMLTYRVRKHVFESDDKDAVLIFPSTVEVRFYLRPVQPFCIEPGGGGTAVRARPARANFDANSGQHTHRHV